MGFLQQANSVQPKFQVMTGVESGDEYVCDCCVKKIAFKKYWHLV